MTTRRETLAITKVDKAIQTDMTGGMHTNTKPKPVTSAMAGGLLTKRSGAKKKSVE